MSLQAERDQMVRLELDFHHPPGSVFGRSLQNWFPVADCNKKSAQELLDMLKRSLADSSEAESADFDWHRALRLDYDYGSVMRSNTDKFDIAAPTESIVIDPGTEVIFHERRGAVPFQGRCGRLCQLCVRNNRCAREANHPDRIHVCDQRHGLPDQDMWWHSGKRHAPSTPPAPRGSHSPSRSRSR